MAVQSCSLVLPKSALRLFVTSLSLASMLVFPRACRANEGEEAIKRIVDIWMARTSIKTLRVDAFGNCMTPKALYSEPRDVDLPATATGDIPAEDTTVELHRSWEIDFAGSRFRKDQRSSIFNLSNLRFHPHHRIYLFDGKDLCVESPRDTNFPDAAARPTLQPDLHVYTANETVMMFDVSDYPVIVAGGAFHLSGMFDPTRIRAPTPDALQLSYVGEARRGDRSCIVVRAAVNKADPGDSFDEFWVDIEHGASILHWERVVHRALFAQIDIEYSARGPDEWIPKNWKCTAYMPSAERDAPRRLLSVTEIVPTTWDVNVEIPKSDFEARKSPDMVISDHVKDVEGRIASDGISVVEFSSNADRKSLPWGWITCIALIALGCLGLMMWWRYSKGSAD